MESKRVWIVDDEPDVCFLFSRILLKRNVSAGYAGNLKEATRLLETNPPALVFLDNSLPDGQGIDFIPLLKNKYPGVKVVMVTANDTATDKNKAFQKGADEFLGKPLSLDLINRTIDNIMLDTV